MTLVNSVSGYSNALIKRTRMLWRISWICFKQTKCWKYLFFCFLFCCCWLFITVSFAKHFFENMCCLSNVKKSEREKKIKIPFVSMTNSEIKSFLWFLLFFECYLDLIRISLEREEWRLKNVIRLYFSSSKLTQFSPFSHWLTKIFNF